MGWTKRQLIQEAFSEIGFSDDFNVQPEEYERSLRRLDSMMALWNGKGIRLGYNLSDSPEKADIDSDSGLPDVAYEAVFMNLALRIAPGYGKTANQVTAVAAKQAYDTLLSRAVFPTPQPMPNTMPIGAGNRSYGRRFFPTPCPVIEAGADDPITF